MIDTMERYDPEGMLESRYGVRRRQESYKQMCPSQTLTVMSPDAVEAVTMDSEVGLVKSVYGETKSEASKPLAGYVGGCD